MVRVFVAVFQMSDEGDVDVIFTTGWCLAGMYKNRRMKLRCRHMGHDLEMWWMDVSGFILMIDRVN